MRNKKIQILLIKPKTTENGNRAKRLTILESHLWKSTLSTESKKAIERNLKQMKSGKVFKTYNMIAWIPKNK